MSNRPCNKCSLQRMREDAVREHKRVVVIPVKPNQQSSRLGGSDVFVVRPGKKPSSANWAAWFMEIPATCQC